MAVVGSFTFEFHEHLPRAHRFVASCERKYYPEINNNSPGATSEFLTPSCRS